jgi:hypothetical protein
LAFAMAIGWRAIACVACGTPCTQQPHIHSPGYTHGPRHWL